MHRQPARERLHIAQGALPLLIAHIEPELRPVRDLRRPLVEIAEDALVVPPHAGGHYRQSAESMSQPQAEVQRHQSAERRTA